MTSRATDLVTSSDPPAKEDGPLGEMRKLWQFADAKGFDRDPERARHVVRPG